MTRWDVDKLSLANYLDSIPTFYFPQMQPSRALYEEDLMLLFSKKITTVEFCKRLRHVQKMWMLEQ